MWEERFAASEDFLFGKAPARFLEEHAGYLKAGQNALSVADGEGRNSVYMAEHGMDVTALEFAPTAIERARDLAKERGVSVDFRQSDVLTRDWESDAYDLVAGIFIQFVGPDGRRVQFKGMQKATKPSGLVMLHGYTPKQLEHGTGGPPFAQNMYTEVILRAAFVGWDILECREYEREVQEGRGHSGMSALIDFVARKPA
jgi:cyclopropane fatty-acyl-phospholipid synthase-like methyltransferase